MKFTTTLISLAIATSAAIAPTAFAQSADLSIAGRIFPGACIVDLGNGGVADLGNIRKDSLNVDQPTLLEPVMLPASVSCESEVRFALQAIDNAADSSVSPSHYGIGMTPADEKIGRMTVGFADTLVDGGPAFRTRSSNDGQSWTSASFDTLYNFDRADFIGFTKSSGGIVGPDPIKDLTANLRVIARIEPASTLTISDDVPINGSVTINLHYL
ncbi:DUF1120 domain-containing protein [uncultured Stenotrophomonas sp.]|uniref:DUF1120 domain-containing protein n=1 Tax=uncultured Stenotrophomonas sp. TaxID=165438 RepID=UPI0028E92780|nr:DUF1120 domain-containing protein [uncultured Stenotrophomonas sp.]